MAWTEACEFVLGAANAVTMEDPDIDSCREAGRLFQRTLRADTGPSPAETPLTRVPLLLLSTKSMVFAMGRVAGMGTDDCLCFVDEDISASLFRSCLKFAYILGYMPVVGPSRSVLSREVKKDGALNRSNVRIPLQLYGILHSLNPSLHLRRIRHLEKPTHRAKIFASRINGNSPDFQNKLPAASHFLIGNINQRTYMNSHAFQFTIF